ncbi:hypothetical protein [Nonomuraea typhae]|uniref:ABC transporter permease n=1 Tax=Nonomuraea typhae TaxID=2603600 RepID=A0ABW7YSQ1_9ACTN
MIEMLAPALLVVWLMVLPIALMLGSVVLALCEGRRWQVALGAVLVTAGTATLALTAWFTREGDHTSWFVLFVAVVGAGLLLLGMGPFVPWFQRRIPGVRDLNRATAGITMTATALVVMITVVATAGIAQDRAGYTPNGPMGTLTVSMLGFGQADEQAARAAMQSELPGVPIIRGERASSEDVVDFAAKDEGPMAEYIGDQAFLRYLTGNKAVYDPQKAVLLTTNPRRPSAVEVSAASGPPITVPATAATPSHPVLTGVFIPTPLYRSLGHIPELGQLIVDPATRRITPAEARRIDNRLDGLVSVHLEQGYQPPTAWLYVVAALAALALGAAVWPSFTSRRLLTPIGRPAAVATAAGALAGGGGGWLLAWPFTAPGSWDDPARVIPFEVPWLPMLALTATLPLLAASIAAARRTF